MTDASKTQTDDEGKFDRIDLLEIMVTLATIPFAVFGLGLTTLGMLPTNYALTFILVIMSLFSVSLSIYFLRDIFRYRTMKRMNSGMNAVVKDLKYLTEDSLSWRPLRDREEMYGLGTSIINNAKTRLYIVQATSSLLLPTKHKADDILVAALKTWIKSTEKEEGRTCWYLYNDQATRLEMEEKIRDGKLKLTDLDDLVNYYKDFDEKSKGKFQFSSISSNFSGPMAIGDDRIAIWIIGGRIPYVAESDKKSIADDLEGIIKMTAGNIKDRRILLAELHRKHS